MKRTQLNIKWKVNLIDRQKCPKVKLIIQFQIYSLSSVRNAYLSSLHTTAPSTQMVDMRY